MSCDIDSVFLLPLDEFLETPNERRDKFLRIFDEEIPNEEREKLAKEIVEYLESSDCNSENIREKIALASIAVYLAIVDKDVEEAMRYLIKALKNSTSLVEDKIAPVFLSFALLSLNNRELRRKFEQHLLEEIDDYDKLVLYSEILKRFFPQVAERVAENVNPDLARFLLPLGRKRLELIRKSSLKGAELDFEILNNSFAAADYKTALEKSLELAEQIHTDLEEKEEDVDEEEFEAYKQIIRGDRLTLKALFYTIASFSALALGEDALKYAKKAVEIARYAYGNGEYFPEELYSSISLALSAEAGYYRGIGEIEKAKEELERLLKEYPKLEDLKAMLAYVNSFLGLEGPEFETLKAEHLAIKDLLGLNEEDSLIVLLSFESIPPSTIFYDALMRFVEKHIEEEKLEPLLETTPGIAAEFAKCLLRGEKLSTRPLITPGLENSGLKSCEFY